MSRYYKPNEIKYTVDNIKFVLENIVEMGKGDWPTNPYGIAESVRTRKPPPGRAPFITSCDVVAEVEARLERAGTDGGIAMLAYIIGMDERHLSRIFGFSEEEIRRRVVRALQYCAGRRRKPYTYSEFVSHRRG